MLKDIVTIMDNYKASSDIATIAGIEGMDDIKELAQKPAPDYTKKLPETEFEVMLSIWGAEPPVNTAYLMKEVGANHGWKAPTLISFLVRLEERGFITSEKKGKERYYYPCSDKAEYIRHTTEDFINRYHSGSFVSLLDSIYTDKKLQESDIDELLRWLKTKY